MQRWIGLIVLAMTGMAMTSASHVPAEHTAPAHGAPVTHHKAATNVEPPTGPEFSNDTQWAGPLAIAIGAMFLAAIVIGPLYRTVTPAEPAADPHHDDAHGHHDPHGGHAAHGHHH